MLRWALYILSSLVLAAGMGLFSMPTQAEETITQSQPELVKMSLSITGRDGEVHRFTVEVARTAHQQEVGEMFRKKIPTDGGMLFIWPHLQKSDMWMRNTLVPLDIIFIDENNRIHAIEENTVPLSEGIISSHGRVGSVLEVPGGTTERLGIVVGDRIESDAFSKNNIK